MSKISAQLDGEKKTHKIAFYLHVKLPVDHTVSFPGIVAAF